MTQRPMVEQDFAFTAKENAHLVDVLTGVKASPYQDYAEFRSQVDQIIHAGLVPDRFVDFCDLAMMRDFARQPLIVVGNSPVDADLPVFDSSRPVESKYELKKTFVAEGYLSLYATLTRTDLIGHLSVNAGDFYHDIYPKASMFDTQSQKTLGTLKFHRDFTNHFVSPDFVNTLTLRDTPSNEVYSTFAATAEALDTLDDATVELLGEQRFYTPFDDVSTTETEVRLGRANDHRAVDEDGARVFEGRTRGHDPEAQAALEAFLGALHQVKRLRVGRPGDSVSFSNRHVIHGREVRQIRDIDQLKVRWLMKTHNVFSLAAFEEFFLNDRYGVVNG